MKKFTLLSIAAIFIFFIISCKSNANLDEDTAADLIAAHLKAKPEYESTRINVGELKFKSKATKQN